jgi:hypothetical protein
MKFEFCGKILKNPQVQIFTKICPVEAEFFRADGQTDVMKVRDAFRSFAKEPKIQFYMSFFCWLTYLMAALQIKSYKGPVRDTRFKKSNADLFKCITFLKGQNAPTRPSK